MLSEISIRDLIDSKGFEGSLITTYNASLPFYEEVLHRRLRANGCRHNVVLMDSAQCSASWESEITRPKRAGFDYSLVPIRSGGAFHPKIAIFAGPKRLALLVGSHNLTVAGLGFNREISNLIEIQGRKHEYVSMLSDVWDSITAWLEPARSYCPPELIDNALRLQDHIRPFLSQPGQSSSARFLYQSADRPSLFQQLRLQVSFPVRRIIVTGAFFDRQLGFLRSLRQAWPSAEIIVGIDPATVVLPAYDEGLAIRFVDANLAWPDDRTRYLHAKVFYLEGDGTQAAFLSGSANPSAPGWGTSSSRVNDEAMILLHDGDAQAALARTELQLLSGFESLAAIELQKAVARGISITKMGVSHSVTVLVGTVNHEAGTITLSLPSCPASLYVKLMDENDQEIEVASKVSIAGQTVTVSLNEHLQEIRSLLLFGDAGAVARVLVHHSQIVDANSASSRQHIIRLALGEIGNADEDVVSLIDQVQQVIFAEETADHVGFRRNSGLMREEVESQRPDTLAVDDERFGRRKKRRRLIESGDLGYLIDTLIRLLHTPAASSSHHVSEPVSVDEEGADEADEPPIEITLDDAAIAAAISRKSRSLIRKMIQREGVAAADKDQAPTMLVQLVAVVAILKELRHLERQGRWKNSSLQLVDSKALESLLHESMFYLFSSSHRLWTTVEGDGGEHFEELDTLNLLLTWLAWEVGYSFTPMVPSRWDAEQEERDWQLAGNGYLAKLLPRVGVEDQWPLLETSIQRSIHPIPKEKKDADEWMESHTVFGDALLDEFTREKRSEAKGFSVGGFAYVPSLMDPWSVVLYADEKKVALWDFEFKDGTLKERNFVHAVVVRATAISNLAHE